MLAPFFIAAMRSPTRQGAFRVAAVVHALVTIPLVAVAANTASESTRITVAYLFLVLGIVEGAAFVGWRLTQIPKSQALEFLMTSSLQPRGVFVAEALVGTARFTLIWLAGLPIVGSLLFQGPYLYADLLPLFVLPLLWGITAGLLLTASVYESRRARRVGEVMALVGVLIYLVIGVVAGENLRLWLEKLPDWAARSLYETVVFLHEWNPFGVVRYWFTRDRVEWIAWERLEFGFLTAFLGIATGGLRCAIRMRGHYHERHYRPREDRRAEETASIGDAPLSWWAVRRVMEYSGRVNLWLAGGFSTLYSAYLVAGDRWPPWMGRLVFAMFENWGGAPMIATAMVVLASVPAVFQFGLWDPTTQERCRRLELLLLTELEARDYAAASRAAAWRRGRGYLVVAALLWGALYFSGANSFLEVFCAATGAVVIWLFSYAVGFRSFSRGAQSNGIASLMTLGFPMLIFVMYRLGMPQYASLIPTGLCFTPLRGGPTLFWLLGLVVTATFTVLLWRQGLSRCDAELRAWYDQNQGTRAEG